MQKISSSNTKAEILKAYNALVATMKSERQENAKLVKQLAEKEKLVHDVKKNSSEGVSSNIETIRITINEQLDLIEKRMHEEQLKFDDLQKAIEVEKQTLEEHYKIKTEAESLDALLISAKQAKEKLQKDYLENKTKLDSEISAQRETWKREQEAYQYELKIKRRNEDDAYNQKVKAQEVELITKKKEFENNIQQREDAVVTSEKELMDLRSKVEAFPKALAQKEEETTTRVEEILKKEFEYKHQLKEKDLQSEIKLLQQQIESLNIKIDNQKQQITALTQQSEKAAKQVQDIALKAIENSGVRNINIPSSQDTSHKHE